MKEAIGQRQGVYRCHTPAALCATSLILSMPCGTSTGTLGTFDPVCSRPVVASTCSNRITTSTVCACVVHNSIMQQYYVLQHRKPIITCLLLCLNLTEVPLFKVTV